jgi:hypothetical protein
MRVGMLACLGVLVGGCGGGSGSGSSSNVATTSGIAGFTVPGANGKSVSASQQTGTIQTGGGTTPGLSLPATSTTPAQNPATSATAVAGGSLSVVVSVPQSAENLFIGIQGAATYYEVDLTQSTRTNGGYTVTLTFGAATPASNVTLQVVTEANNIYSGLAQLPVAITAPTTTAASKKTTASIRAIDLEVCSSSSSAQFALGSTTGIVNWPGPSGGKSLSYDSPPSNYTSETPTTTETEYAFVGGTQVATATNALGAAYYTLALYGECSPPSGSTGLGPTLTQFTDSIPASLPANIAAVRVINLAPSTNAAYAQFDIYSNGAALPGLSGVAYGTISSGGAYTNVAANGLPLDFQLYAHAAGSTSETLVSIPTTSAGQLEGFTPTAGDVYTIFIYGSPDNGSINASYVQDVK